MLRHGSLVAINMTIKVGKDNILISKPIPILYYCNDKENIEDSIAQNAIVKEFVNSNIVDSSTYSNASLNYISFDLDSEDERYVEGSFMIQEKFPMGLNIEEDLTFNIAKSIYKEVFDIEYTKKDKHSALKDIYEKVSLMYQDKITVETFVNLFRKKLNETNVSKENKAIIVNNISETLNPQKHIENEK